MTGQPGHLAIKLIDFGLSIRHRLWGSKFTELVGTRGYIAPELQFDDEASGNPETEPHKLDTWALGAVLFFCATGYHPFLQTRDPALGALQLQHGLFLPMDLGQQRPPPYFETTVRKLLEPNPHKRFSAAEAKKFFTEEKNKYDEAKRVGPVKAGIFQPLSTAQLKNYLRSEATGARIPIQKVKILFVGDFGVGKSKLMRKLSGGNQYVLARNGSSVFFLNFEDTQSTESRRNSLLPQLCNNADLVCLCSRKDPTQMREL